MKRAAATQLAWFSLATSLAVAGCGGQPDVGTAGADGPTGTSQQGIVIGPTTCAVGTHRVCTTGTVCTTPSCVPVITCVCDADPPPAVVVSGVQDMNAMAEDATNIYFTAGAESLSVYSCPKTGCGTAPTLVYGGTASIPWALAVDANFVYWADGTNGTIMKCGKTGCTVPTPVATGQKTPYSIVVDATTVYWTTIATGQSDGTVASCPVSGCSGAPTVLASGRPYPGALTADSTNLYWVDNNPTNVIQMPKTAASAPITLASGFNILELAVDSTSVYWTTPLTYSGKTQEPGNLSKCAIGGCNNTPTVLASGQSQASGVTVTGGAAYYFESTASGTALMRCATGGCGNAPATVAVVSGGRLLSDSSSLYWGAFGANGAVMSLADW